MPTLPSLEPTSVSSRRWAALRARDPSANSAFFYGVTSTQIFCRPTCPARLARRSNIVYFDDISAARNAGYRSCKRCDPCNTSWHRDMRSRKDLLQAQNLIATAAVENKDWNVGEIAAKVGVSVGHLHRLFKKYANTTPRDFAAAQISAHRCQIESQSGSSESLDMFSIEPDLPVVQSMSEPLLWPSWDSWTSNWEQYDTTEPSTLLDSGDPWAWLSSAELLVQCNGESLVEAFPDQVAYTTC